MTYFIIYQNQMAVFSQCFSESRQLYDLVPDPSDCVFFQDIVLLRVYHCTNANERREKEAKLMRKLVVTEFLSLDGVMEDPQWTFPYWNDEIAQFKTEESSSD